MDGNLDALNKWRGRNDAIDKSFETLIENHELSFAIIKGEIAYLLDISRDYDGFDFTDEILMYIKEEICI